MTKAQLHRYEAERTRPRPKRPPLPEPRGAKAAPPGDMPGVSGTQPREAGPHTARRNLSKHAARKAMWALEDSMTARPSRKSTRKSASRHGVDANLHTRETLRTTSPSARAERAVVRKGRST